MGTVKREKRPKGQRRPKRERRPRRRRIRNLNLRASYVLYMVAGMVVAVVGCALTVSLLDAERTRLAMHYEDMGQKYLVPQGGGVDTLYGDQVVYVVYNEEGQVTLRLSADEDHEVAPYVESPSEGIMSLVVVPRYSQQDAQYDMFLGFMMAAAIPLWCVGGAIMCAVLFYRNKLKRPLALLNQAAQRIAGDDLDFTLSYDRRDEMGALCDSFERMRASLSQNNQRMWRAMEERKKVNGAFAHDIRTPLTVMKGYAQILDRHLQTGAPDSVTRPIVATIERQIGRLETFAQQMSQLTKLDDMPFAPKAVDTAALLSQLNEGAQLLCQRQGLTLHFEAQDVPPSMTLDPALITQTFDNLLSNAVGHAAGNVRVRAFCEGGQLFVAVENDGAPFTPEQLDMATAPYYTSGGGNHLGLGLHISQALCEKHSGGLRLNNPPSGGAQTTARFAPGA